MRIHRKRPSMEAFTLIELLVVASILSLAISVIGVSFAAGIRAWETVRDFGASESGVYTGLNIVERDIANTFPFFAVDFNGAPEALVMAGLVDAGEGSVVGLVKYEYDREYGRLLRKRWSFPGEEPDTGEAIISGLDSAAFEYGKISGDGALSWTESWGEGTNLPIVVRLTLEMPEGGRGMSYRKLMLIPSGSRSDGDE